MLGKILKGGAWCATLALTTIGALVFVPDDAWKTFPEPLAPVRAKLADIGVAPDKYRTSGVELGRLDSDAESANGGTNDVFSAKNGRFFENRGDGRTAVRIGRRDAFSQRNSIENAKSELEDTPTSSDFGSASGLKTNRDASSSVFNAQFDENKRANVKDFNERNGQDEASSRNGVENGNAANAGLVDENSTFDSFSSIDSVETSSDRTGTSSASASPSNDYPDSNEIPPFFAENESQLAPNNEPNDKGETSSPSNETAFVPETGAQNSVVDADYELKRALDEATALDAERKAESGTNAASSHATPNSVESSFARQTKDVFLTLDRIRRERGGSLSPEKQAALNEALDRLAFDVFYNPTQAILEPFYVVAKGDTLASIASKFSTTPETLGAINGLDVALDAPLPTGATLKTVRGPVAAELSASKRELLLTFDGLYAGRFAFGLPENSAALRGKFAITGKIVNPSCNAVDASGASVSIPGGAPENPLGAVWISLNDGLGLQGTNRPELVGTIVSENGGFIFNNREISQLSVLLPIGADVVVVD